MAVLRNGGKAVDAVEIAIKILEDREITNAGYGSNLAIDGVVEGDAVVVDHNGRSGAVGAIARTFPHHLLMLLPQLTLLPEVKNPISVARTVLDLSTSQLTLRRVPPNLLVGQGATDWAFVQGIPILPHDALVSPSARDRWYRWKQDLKNEEKKRARQQRDVAGKMIASQDPPPEYQESVRSRSGTERSAALRSVVWNEGQPTSPSPSVPAVGPTSQSGFSTPSRASSVDSRATPETPNTPISDNEHASAGSSEPLTAASLRQASQHASRKDSIKAQDAASDSRQPEISDEESEYMDVAETGDDEEIDFTPQERHITADACDDDNEEDEQDYDDASSSTSTIRLPSLTPSPPPVEDEGVTPISGPGVAMPVRSIVDESQTSPQPTSAQSDTQPDVTEPAFSHQAAAAAEDLKDLVFDTVGAIAIDNDGNIACGASSGGIGMKFRGRIGPAALVGVGAAVCPIDPDDKSKISTACVTSGTGEHMATTGAAQVCADRLYNSVRKRRGGGFEPCEEDQAVKAMIENDFMGKRELGKCLLLGPLILYQVTQVSEPATPWEPSVSWRSRKRLTELTSTLLTTLTRS